MLSDIVSPVAGHVCSPYNFVGKERGRGDFASYWGPNSSVCFFLAALNQSTKTHLFSAGINLLRGIVESLGALISTRLASSVMLYPLMPHMIQE